MHRSEEEFMTRLGYDLFISTAVAVAEICEGDTLRGLVFLATWRLNVRRLNEPGIVNALAHGGRFPDIVRTPVASNAVAKFLGLPRETVRRHLKALVRAGLCTYTASGYVIPVEVLDRAEVRRLRTRVAEEVERLGGDLRKIEPDREQCTEDWRNRLKATRPA